MSYISEDYIPYLILMSEFLNNRFSKHWKSLFAFQNSIQNKLYIEINVSSLSQYRLDDSSFFCEVHHVGLPAVDSENMSYSQGQLHFVEEQAFEFSTKRDCRVISVCNGVEACLIELEQKFSKTVS